MAATVREVMTTGVHWVAPTTTLGEAVALMARHRIGSTLVMDGPRLVGIFTERDTVRALAASEHAPSQSVTAWMTADPLTVTPDETVERALKIMLEHDFRHLPVVENGEVVGVVSIRDVAD